MNKTWKKLLAVSFSAAMLMANACYADDEVADSSINPDHAQFWRETLQKYRVDDDVHQILLVRYTGGCSARAVFYTKSEYNDAWVQMFESEATVGKLGAGEKRGEGHPITPFCDISVRRGFGILPNPGTSLEYVDVIPTTFACDEDCEYYNQIIDSKETGHACTGEEMYMLSPEYNYGIETTYNDENEYPKGSAIFIHCKGAKGFTGGCVALDQEDMETILKNADEHMRIVIGED